MIAYVPFLRSGSKNALQVISGDRYIVCTVGETQRAAAVLQHGGSALSHRHSTKKTHRDEDNAILINKFNSANMEMCR